MSDGNLNERERIATWVEWIDLDTIDATRETLRALAARIRRGEYVRRKRGERAPKAEP